MKLKQSDLLFKENSKSCVWCSYGVFEFYWERGVEFVVVSDSMLEDAKLGYSVKTSKDARKEVVDFLNRI